MVPLAVHKRVWTWCSVYPVKENTRIWKRIFYAFFTAVCFIANVCVVPASIAYGLEYISSDIEGSLHALFHIASYTGLSYVLINAFVQRQQVTEIFNQLDLIYYKYKGEDSFLFMVEANETSEWMWPVYLSVLRGTLYVCFFSTFSSIYLVLKAFGSFEAKYLYHPYNVVLPWDVTTPLGYAGEFFLFHIITGQAYMFTSGAIVLLFASMCLHHRAFSRMFESALQKLEFYAKTPQNKQLIVHQIQFYNTVKSWMSETAEIYSPFVLVQLIFLTICISCIVFQFDLQLQHPGFDLVIMVVAFIFCASTPFVYCFYGEMATTSYERMDECVYESNWLELPIDLQKTILLMIANMQQSVSYSGFGVAELNLVTFGTIIRAVASYYMTFKTFAVAE